MEGLVRTSKPTGRSRGTHPLDTAERGTCQDTVTNSLVMGTHSLKTAEGGTCHDMERNRPSEGHSLPGEHKAKARSGHVKGVRAQRDGNKRNPSVKYGSKKTD